MKKYCKYILICILALLTSFTNVKALDNACESENNVNCAFCVYDINESCRIKFSVTYKGDSTPLNYKEYLASSNNSAVKCNFDYNNFIKDNFVDSSGNIVCPTLSKTQSQTSQGSRNWTFDIKINVDNYGTIKSTNESVVKKNSSNSNQNNNSSETYVCQYESSDLGDFTISVINGKTSVAGTSKCDKLSTLGLDDNKFSNNKCPDVKTHSYIYAQKKECQISTDLSWQGTLTIGNLINQNTGETTTPNKVSPSTSNITLNLDYNNFCSPDVLSAMKILGYVIFILKIVIPIIIIVLGIMDFAKAVVSDDEKATNKAFQSLIRRLITGVAVFFVPTIISAILSVLEVTGGIHKEDNEEFGSCTKCLLRLECGSNSSISDGSTGSKTDSAGGNNVSNRVNVMQ